MTENKNEEMAKLGVECQGNHDNITSEMEKTGDRAKKCPHCGKTLMVNKKESSE